MSGGGARPLEGIGRSTDGVVGVGRPTGCPIPRRPALPLSFAALAFRGERGRGGDKLRGEGRRHGKDRRLARWSLPERISYFQLPDRPFLQPLPIVGSLLLSFLFFSRRLPPLCIYVSYFRPPRHPPALSPHHRNPQSLGPRWSPYPLTHPPHAPSTHPTAPQTVTLRLLVGDWALPLLRAPLRFSDVRPHQNEVWLSFEGVTDAPAPPGFFSKLNPATDTTPSIFFSSSTPSPRNTAISGPLPLLLLNWLHVAVNFPIQESFFAWIY